MRSKYVSALLRLLTAAQIKSSALNPNAYMTKTDILLHHVALRRIGGSK